jgi:TonB-linked SusC/RagA family outer membrane protein
MMKLNLFSKRATLMLLCVWSAVFAMAQDHLSVTGTVTDQQNEPMIGVNIVEKGTQNATSTDVNGKYVLSVTPGATLVYSFLGYVSEERRATDVVNVTLTEDTKALDEVVVVGYGVQRKSDLTGAISSIKSEDLQNRVIPRAEQALQGKTAGVQLVNTSAKPGSSPTVRVRGFSSNGVSDPLFVVDGLRISDLGAIDPSTIASIEVLKDAASAAIYGAQAGNGVVLVTTKTGSKGKSSITYDFQYALTNLTRIPKIINAQEAIALMKETDPSVTDGYVQTTFVDSKRWDGQSSTDWFDVAFNTGIVQRHSITAQGANDRGSYFLSVNNYDENGIVRGDRDVYNRLTGTVNGSYQIKPWLKVGTTNNLERFSQKTITDGQGAGNVYSSMIANAITLTPLMASTYASDKLPDDMTNFLAKGYTLLKDENGNYYGCWAAGESVHPIVSTLANNNETYGYNVQGTTYIDLSPVKGLTFTSRVGYRLSSINNYYYANKYVGTEQTSNTTVNGVNRTNNTTIYYQWENYAAFAKTFAEKHHMNLMAGMSYSENDNTYLYAGVNNVMKDNPAFQDVSYPAADATKDARGYRTYSRRLSYYGRVEYNFDNRYYIHGVFRADAADLSLLPKDNRWGYFPGVSAGWNISNEAFFPKTPYLTFAKLRASWGQNGSTSNLGGYRYANSIAQTALGYPYGSTPATFITAGAPNQVENPALKWETSEQFDIGVDLRLLKDRLTITADYFNKKTKDLIVNGVQLPAAAGNSAPPMNAGNVQNTGFELELGWRDDIGDFTYGVNANLATLKNKVTYLDPSISDNRMYGSVSLGTLTNLTAFEVGHPIWYFYGYKVKNIDPATGLPVFDDMVDGEAGLTTADRTNVGSSIPTATYGITLTAAWKGIDFLLFGSGAVGNKVFSALNYTGFTYAYKEIYDNRWTAANPNGKYASPTTSGSDMQNYITSDASIFDASYFKIKQIQLGYTLPQAITKKFFVEHLRVFVSLEDFFCFTKYHGLDPEVSATATSGMGIDYGNYPNTRKTLFGVTITF